MLVKMKSLYIPYTKLFPQHKLFFASVLGFGTIAYLSRNTKSASLKLAIVGSLSMTICDLLTHPFIVINTRVKSNVSTKINSIQIIKNIYAKEGPFGFLRGISSTYYMCSYGGFIYFGIYKFIKSSMKLETKKENRVYNACVFLISASLSEFLSICAIYPFEYIRTKMIIHKNSIPNIEYPDMIKFFKNELNGKLLNLFKLYTGSGICFVYFITSRSIAFTVLEVCREYFKIKNNRKSINDLLFSEYFMCSFAAGVSACLCTNFIDTMLINKQILGDKFKVTDFFKKNGFTVFTSGLGIGTVIERSMCFLTIYFVDSFANSLGVEL